MTITERPSTPSRPGDGPPSGRRRPPVFRRADEPSGQDPTAASPNTTVRATAGTLGTDAASINSREEDGVGWYLLRSVLSMVSVFALALIGNLVVVSHLQHASAQQNLRDRVRIELANGVAPVQAVDPGTHLQLAEGRPIGILNIPDIDLDEVVVFGTVSSVLMNGVGLRRDSTFPGQRGSAVIMGRSWSYGGPFGSIDKLTPGSAVTVTTGQGVQRFSVVAVRRAGDPLPPAAPTGSRLTLITTTGSALQPGGIVRVDADLLGTAQPTAPPAVSALGLRPAERAMAGDPSNVGTLIFALQALLAAVVAGVVAWRRWGHMQAWVVCAPLALLAGLWVADNVTALLPNLM